jgi:DNA (cytosine-5)-methyltransferase 1
VKNDMANKQSALRELALFAGAGGGILGGHLLGWRTVCAVERDAYAASVLVARQNDKSLPVFPIWSDVTTFDGRPWRGLVDVISGGFPCQDISAAGKGAGIGGARSGLWSEFARIISEILPRYVFVENSPLLTKRGIDRVLGDLAKMGYDARWCVLGADDCGAPHERKRIWIVASNTNGSQLQRASESLRIQKDVSRLGGIRWWKVEPKLGRVANELAYRLDRLRAIGNGQVPIVAATAWQLLVSGFYDINQ